jgi:hypothetical protein
MQRQDPAHVAGRPGADKFGYVTVGQDRSGRDLFHAGQDLLSQICQRSVRGQGRVNLVDPADHAALDVHSV